jgi:hypothetical protein
MPVIAERHPGGGVNRSLGLIRRRDHGKHRFEPHDPPPILLMTNPDSARAAVP